MPSRTRALPIAPVTPAMSSVSAPGIPSDRASKDDAAEAPGLPGFSAPANPAMLAPSRAPLRGGIARPNHPIGAVMPGRGTPAPGRTADVPPIRDAVASTPPPAVFTGASAFGAPAGRANPNQRTVPAAPPFHPTPPEVKAPHRPSPRGCGLRLTVGQGSDAADRSGGFGVCTARPASGETTGTIDGSRHHGHRPVFIPRTEDTPAERYTTHPRRADTRDARQPAGTGHLAPANTAARGVPARAAGVVHSAETASISGEASASPPRGMTERNPMNERRPGPGVTHA